MPWCTHWNQDRDQALAGVALSAHDFGWIMKTKDTGEVVRECHNTIHPQKELSHGTSLEPGDAQMPWEVARRYRSSSSTCKPIGMRHRALRVFRVAPHLRDLFGASNEQRTVTLSEKSSHANGGRRSILAIRKRGKRSDVRRVSLMQPRSTPATLRTRPSSRQCGLCDAF